MDYQHRMPLPASERQEPQALPPHGCWQSPWSIALGMLGLILLSALFIWQYLSVQQRVTVATTERIRGASLQGIILQLDEVLTMSAQMASVTGNPVWEERYRKYEVELDSAIKEATALEKKSGNALSSKQTDEANQKLISIENQAFNLARSKRLTEAAAQLAKPEYAQQKKIYAEGTHSMLANLEKNLSAAVGSHTNWSRLLLTVGSSTLLGMVFTCIIIIGRLRSSRLGLAQAIEQKEQARAAAQQGQAELQAIFDHTPAAMYLKDLRGNKLLRNKRATLLNWGATTTILHASEQQVVTQQTPVEAEELLSTATEKDISLWTIHFPLFSTAHEVMAICGIALDITSRKQAEAALVQTQKKLLESSRHAGMAEVATGILHNVGNVLNSVNVSTNLVVKQLRQSKSHSFTRITQMLAEPREGIGSYLAADPRGLQLISLLKAMADGLQEEQQVMSDELLGLRQNVEHIKRIITMQQSYASLSGVREVFHMQDMVEDAVRMLSAGLERHHIEVRRHFSETPPVLLDRHKVLQIIINLISNAKDALADGTQQSCISLSLQRHGADRVRLQVTDNGIGIPAENFTQIFQYGYTTKEKGHGFGLHSGANFAKELGGSLTVFSAGVGQGATFTLELPTASAEEAALGKGDL